ncbi:hypothetical protein F0P96_13995 [Hymenobacter busanensis]|uniref:Uncharacterized protein n=1 Tax=Hymenobacter busanensis TaxID=2607656 RepID=A0A7L4ZZ37_9BACT|nr:hypothetical protein [Hymenobacter busanensis]KAA9331355.1 hypothetical protein F0P96_13995 [Hymenobacter busanensis]QHJ08508.1 hypothetical protein GUY19_14920 [Hymenobacter busanensis]
MQHTSTISPPATRSSGVVAWFRTWSHTTAVWLCVSLIGVVAIFYAADWTKRDVIIDDVAGYYDYLPSAFITHDLGDPQYLAELHGQTRPDREKTYGQLHLPNGRIVFRYPIGMAILYSPWFAIAHGYELAKNQDALGLSANYQKMLQLGCFVYAMLGLWLLGRELRRYFPDTTAGLALLGIGLATNFFCYATYESPMTHGCLFLLNVLLLICTRRWYANGSWRNSAALGMTLGMMALVRPSEMMMVLVPALWGLTSWAAVRERGQWLARHLGQVLLVGLCMGLVGSIQLLFWRIVGGYWVLDTYPGENFNFKDSHLLDGLFSIRKGWLFYTPIMALALLGIFFVRRYVRPALLPLLVVVPLVVYVTFCWWDWGYGGSFSARPLISLYPLLSLALASCFQRVVGVSGLRWILGLLLLVLALHNLKQTHQYYLGLINCCEENWENYKKYFFDLEWPNP